MKKQISAKRRKMLQQLLHEMRETEIKDIERQLGRELDPSVIRKVDVAMDTGDWAQMDLSEGVDHKILEIRYRTYKEIADTFRRLESGAYGLCESCGAQIPLGRLKAEPFARYCVPCLTRIEELERVENETGKPPSL